MKRFLLAAAFAAALLTPAAIAPTQTHAACYGSTWVNGYYRADGTYVSGHYRSCPNGSTRDNWTTRGNENPWTGTPGTRDPYSTPWYPSRSYWP